MEWKDLITEEQEKWQKTADNINEEKLGLFVTVVSGLIKDKILEIADNKLRITGTFAFKMKSEKGCEPEHLKTILDEQLRNLLPGNLKPI